MKDVLIVGGGPAGTALAVQLGRRGLTVDLLDRSHFPRDKPCGEGILPPGVEVLKKMGLADALGGKKLRGVRYHVGDYAARADFGVTADGAERFGLGQRRQLLDNSLWNAAAKTPGVSVHPGATVERVLLDGDRAVGVLAGGTERRARWIVAADGSSSAIRRDLQLEHIFEPKRLGVRAHFSNVSSNPQGNDIQVFLRAGYEIYVTPLPDQQLLVAALAAPEHAKKIRRNFWIWCAQEPLLRDWLKGAQQSSPLMGRSALRRRLGPGRRPHCLTFIGDAAASSDPITAGGISLALKDAELLAETLPEMIRGSRLAEQRFMRAQNAALRTHRILGGSLLLLSELPKTAAHACQLLGSFPWAMNALVGLAAR